MGRGGWLGEFGRDLDSRGVFVEVLEYDDDHHGSPK